VTSRKQKRESWCVSGILSCKLYDPNDLEKTEPKFECRRTGWIGNKAISKALNGVTLMKHLSGVRKREKCQC